MSDRRLRHADSAAFRHAMRALSSGVRDHRLRRGRRSRRMHNHVARFAVARPADAHRQPCALVLDLHRIASGGRVLDQPARRPPPGARPSLQRPQRRPRAAPFRWRAMDHALDRRPCSRRRDRGLRLPDRRGHRASFARDRARRGRELARGRRGTGARAPPRRLHAVGLGPSLDLTEPTPRPVAGSLGGQIPPNKIQASPNKIKAGRNKTQARRNKIQARRNEIQTSKRLALFV